MRRYELNEGALLYWTIELKGTHFTACEGIRRDGVDKETRKREWDYKFDVYARREYRVQVLWRERVGFRLVASTPEDDAVFADEDAKIVRNPELEAALRAAPDDRAIVEVYGDWLSDQGDPRGELIAVHLALERSPDDPALREHEAYILAAHDYALFGDLAPDVDRGPGRSRIGAASSKARASRARCRWRNTNGSSRCPLPRSCASCGSRSRARSSWRRCQRSFES